MTEDEAFIRAIVDSPGDDTPRLVYADWLDDHNDPRGAYLRAEVKWAEPWTRGTPPGWSDRRPGRSVPEWSRKNWKGLDAMLGRAAPLDPLWVARVSRPPLGVCCDHLSFEYSGPELGPEDVETAEEELGLSFPPAFTAFLLNDNGGQPNRHQLVVRVGDDYDWIGLDHFAPLPAGGRNPGGRKPGLETVWDLRDELTYFGEELGEFGDDDVMTRYVPFARSGSSFLLLLDCEQTPGEVYGIDLEAEAPAPEPLVPSLPQLLGRIITGGI